MKRKIFVITLMSMLFCGIVSAASLWGSYKGNAIVKVNVDGNQYKTAGVPAIVYNGQVMLPLNALKMLDVKYAWDAKNQTVNIIKPTLSGQQPVNQQETIPSMSQFSIKDISKDMKNINVEFVEYVSDGKGFNMLTFHYDYTMDQFFKIKDSLDTIFTAGLKTDATLIKIMDNQNNSIGVYDFNLKSFYAGKLSSDELAKTYIVDGTYFKNPTQTTNGATITAPSTPTTPSSSGVVESKIDGDFEGYDNGKIFKLLNGQIWQQTDYHYHYTYKYSPSVTIYQDGSQWYMIVDGVDGKVTVEQLK